MATLVGSVSKAKDEANALRQEFEDNQEHWRRRIAEKGPEDEMRAEIASRWQQWSIDHPGTQTAKLEKLKADGSHKQRGNVWFNKGASPMQATLREVLPGGLMDTNDQPMTPRMVTLWYRAPEILIKDAYGPYGLPSDLWSLGITFAELEKGYAPFQHKHELGMMATISASLGGYRVSTHSSVLLSKCNWGFRYGQDFAELVSALLKVDPRYRITTSKASELAFSKDMEWPRRWRARP